MFIEPLQELALQMRLKIVASHIEVRQIFQISSERTKDHISARSLKEILKLEQCAKVFT